MKLHRAITIGCLAVAIAFTANYAVAQDPPAAPAEADVVATIGKDAVVTRDEFDRALDVVRQRHVMQGGDPNQPVDQEQQLELLNVIVDTKLEYVLAKKAGVEVTDAEIQSELDERAQQLGGMNLETYLEMSGITLDQLKQLLSEQLAITRFREKQADAVAEVTEADLTAEYEKMKADGEFDRVDVSHILIRVEEGADEAGWTEAKTRIDAARKRVTEGGEAFGEVAKEVSEDPGVAQNGGSYPDTPRGRMVPEFDAKMFEVPVGEISEPFRTQFGWHILTPTARDTIALADISDRLKVFMTEQRVNSHVQDLVASAKAETEIEIRLEENPE